MPNLLQGISMGLAGLSGNPQVAQQVGQTVRTDNLLDQLNALDPNQALTNPAFAQLASVNPNAASAYGTMIKAKGEEKTKREQALARDALFTSKFLEDGMNEKAITLLENRVTAVEGIGGDPSDTKEVLDLIKAGKSDQAHELLQFALQRAQMAGYIPGQEFVKDLGDGRYLVKDRFGNLKPSGTAGGSKNDLKIAEEARSGIRKSLRTIGDEASVIKTNFNKVMKLVDEVEKGNRTATAQALVAIVKLGDPGSVVKLEEMRGALNTQNPVAAISDLLQNKGTPENVANSVAATVDPLNPNIVRVGDLINTANALVTASVPILQENYTTQRAHADELLGNQILTRNGVQSLFSGGLETLVKSLGDLSPSKPTETTPPAATPQTPPQEDQGTAQIGRFTVQVVGD